MVGSRPIPVNRLTQAAADVASGSVVELRLLVRRGSINEIRSLRATQQSPILAGPD